jgi:hypothetical protein
MYAMYMYTLLCMFTSNHIFTILSGQTYPWVVPLRTSHSKLLKPIELQDNIELT